SQMAASPLEFCHRMSARPSPLKSPLPTACQLGPGLPRTALPITLVPFISQIATEPSSFCHRISAKPSRLNSPVALMCQAGPGLPPSVEKSLVEVGLQCRVKHFCGAAGRHLRRVGRALVAELGEQERLADLLRHTLEIADQRLVAGDRLRISVAGHRRPAGDQ